MPARDKTAENLIRTTGADIEVPEDVQGNLDLDVNSAVLSTTELTDLAGDKAKQLMTGEIPDDLKEQISDLSGSTGMAGGFGFGEAGRKLEARDFGKTSLELQERGAALANQTAQVEGQTTQLLASMEESSRNYQLALGDQKTSQSQLALLGMEMITKNQQYVSGLMNDLIIANSARPIEGVQGNVDALAGNTETGQAGFFYGANTAISDLISKYL
jgi:hypothetical protein